MDDIRFSAKKEPSTYYANPGTPFKKNRLLSTSPRFYYQIISIACGLYPQATWTFLRGSNESRMDSLNRGLRAEGTRFLLPIPKNEKGIEAFGNDDSGSIAFGMRGTLRTILITSITTQPNMAIDSGPPIGLIRQFTSTSKWGITTRTGAARSLPTSKISNSNSSS